MLLVLGKSHNYVFIKTEQVLQHKRTSLDGQYKAKHNQISTASFPIPALNFISKEERIMILKKLYCYLWVLTLS